jgi:hypothetical protein
MGDIICQITFWNMQDNLSFSSLSSLDTTQNSNTYRS